MFISMQDVANPLFDSRYSMSSSRLSAGGLDIHLEDMSAKAMKRLEYVFKVAEERDGPLNYDTFKDVLQAVLGHRVSSFLCLLEWVCENCVECFFFLQY